MTGEVPRKVLILAEAGDPHATTVAARLRDEHGLDYFIWDSSRYPAQDKVVFETGLDGRVRTSLISPAVGRVLLAEFQSIWWRRPAPARIPDEAGPEFFRRYCRRESANLLRGAFSTTTARIYNDPIHEQRAERKAYQIERAQILGMRVPKTLMTNSEEDVRRFYRALNGRIVFKPFNAPPATFYGTQRMTAAMLKGLSLLDRSPMIFQEEIPPEKDIRVVVVGDRVFAAESSSRQLDWRLDSEVRWTRHYLPRDLERMAIEFVRSMGLDLGSLDFRTRGTEYYFLEINPNGQFLFLEVDDPRLRISSAVAEMLASKSSA